MSELLGSWGDNELSPECLDGAQRFLKDGGVSIPQEYTSYIAPMSSHKVPVVFWSINISCFCFILKLEEFPIGDIGVSEMSKK